MKQAQKFFSASIRGYLFASCLVLLAIGIPAVQAADYTVTLTILNAPTETGEVAVVRGQDIEVEFIVDDPSSELSSNDKIRLVRVDYGNIIHEKKTRQ